jgi:hypothetical protein
VQLSPLEAHVLPPKSQLPLLQTIGVWKLLQHWAELVQLRW